MPSSTNLSPPWIDLPRDVTAKILHKLGAVEVLATAQNVCTAWRSVCRDPSMWRSIDIGDTIHDCHLRKMCRRAVDLSQGQLADITIGYFCDGDLLTYISERCPCLRRLELVYCEDIDGDSLSAALQNLPLLEELHCLYCSRIYVVDAMGISCPLLKSFKLHNYSSGVLPSIRDRDAVRISRTMPQLRHLELIRNGISNRGLEAILDGCAHLEALDLRGCNNLDFSGDIVEACSRRIKGLRLPFNAWFNDERFYCLCYQPTGYVGLPSWSFEGDSVRDYENDQQLPGGVEDSPDCEDYEDFRFCDTRGALKREAGSRPSLRRPQKCKGGARPALRRPHRRAIRREAQRLELRS